MKEPKPKTIIPNSDASISAESLGIEPIEEDLWTFFDKQQFDASANSKIVSLSKLVYTKNPLPNPDVVTGKKPHPVQKAYSYFLRAVAKDPLVSPRKPVMVTANADGTYTIVDGYATVQAAIFVGWKFVPVMSSKSRPDASPARSSLISAQRLHNFRFCSALPITC